MCLKNIPELGLVNGSRGVVVGFEPDPQEWCMAMESASQGACTHACIDVEMASQEASTWGQRFVNILSQGGVLRGAQGGGMGGGTGGGMGGGMGGSMGGGAPSEVSVPTAAGAAAAKAPAAGGGTWPDGVTLWPMVEWSVGSHEHPRQARHLMRPQRFVIEQAGKEVAVRLQLPLKLYLDEDGTHAACLMPSCARLVNSFSKTACFRS